MDIYIVSERKVVGGIEGQELAGPRLDDALLNTWVDHSSRPDVGPTAIAVFSCNVDDANLPAILANTDVHVWQDNPQGLADWLTVKGVTQEEFDIEISGFVQDNPEFVAAMQAVRDLL